MTESKYKCENHQLDLICRGCMKAWIARHDRMLKYLKTLGWLDTYTDEDIAEFNHNGSYLEAKEARDLLKEIGELDENN